MTLQKKRKPQVILVGNTGSLEGIDFKEGGFNLKGMGKASMVRATDIEWDETDQGYRVRFLTGRCKGTVMGVHLLYRARGVNMASHREHVVFPTYNEAVDAEVDVIQWAIRSGKKELFID